MIGTAVKELLLENKKRFSTRRKCRQRNVFKSIKSCGISLIASSLFQDSCVR